MNPNPNLKRSSNASEPMDASNKRLADILEGALAKMGRARAAWTPRFALREFGTITSIASGIAKVSGLPGIGFEEVLRFADGSNGIAFLSSGI